MIKPTVFFSHSSKDQKVISKLKEQLVKKTGNSIDFFSSSDGQSVSFGKNWVHSVEKALSESSIMFVFLTPNSIHSNWIYFESGFSYSKGIGYVCRVDKHLAFAFVYYFLHPGVYRKTLTYLALRYNIGRKIYCGNLRIYLLRKMKDAVQFYVA